jgi:hypothetical protein
MSALLTVFQHSFREPAKTSLHKYFIAGDVHFSESATAFSSMK